MKTLNCNLLEFIERSWSVNRKIKRNVCKSLYQNSVIIFEHPIMTKKKKYYKIFKTEIMVKLKHYKSW